MERATGIEPVTSSLGSWHSTAELRPPRARQRIFLYCINPALSMNKRFHGLSDNDPSDLNMASEGAKKVAPETARV